MRYAPRTLAICIAVLFTASPLTAQQTSHDRSMQILGAMSNVLADAGTIKMRAEKSFDEVLPTGQKLQYSGFVDVGIERPNRFYARETTDLGDREVWYTGDEIVLIDHDKAVYGVQPSEGTIEWARYTISEVHRAILPLLELFSGQFYQNVQKDLLTSRYIARRQIGDFAVDHILLLGQRVNVQLWINAGDRHLPLKMVVTFVLERTQPQWNYRFSDWEIDATLPDEVFRPQVPEGYSLVPGLPLDRESASKWRLK